MIDQKYGDTAEETARWRRVVCYLDDWLPGWRAPYAHATIAVIGDAAISAISQLRKDKATLERRVTDLTRLARAQDARIRELSTPEPTPPRAPHVDSPVQHNDGVVRYPEWEVSYTRKVVHKLAAMLPWLHRQYQSEVVREAIKLLKDYHQTQHEVYEGRDKARKQAAENAGNLVVAREQLETARKVVNMHLAERNRAQQRAEDLLGEVQSWRAWAADAPSVRE